MRRIEIVVAAVPIAVIAGIVIAISVSATGPGPAGAHPAPTATSASTSSPTPTGASTRSSTSAWLRAAPTMPTAPRADADWLTKTVGATGIPRRALEAYAAASLHLTAEQPQCHLSWQALAAIGKVVGDNGTLGGSEINAAGEPIGLVVGPILHVADSDGGRWDGIAFADRAVGPMHLLPGVWAAFGADGSGDAIADPNQIDDAALGAARLLCSWGDLTTPGTWQVALAGYDPFDDRAEQISDLAARYVSESGA